MCCRGHISNKASPPLVHVNPSPMLCSVDSVLDIAQWSTLIPLP